MWLGFGRCRRMRERILSAETMSYVSNKENGRSLSFRGDVEGMTYCRFGEAGQFGLVVTAGLYGNCWECGFMRPRNSSHETFILPWQSKTHACLRFWGCGRSLWQFFRRQALRRFTMHAYVKAYIASQTGTISLANLGSCMRNHNPLFWPEEIVFTHLGVFRSCL
jgi:hypothetical protein